VFTKMRGGSDDGVGVSLTNRFDRCSALEFAETEKQEGQYCPRIVDAIRLICLCKRGLLSEIERTHRKPA
jgi:hypothetical protein